MDRIDKNSVPGNEFAAGLYLLCVKILVSENVNAGTRIDTTIAFTRDLASVCFERAGNFSKALTQAGKAGALFERIENMEMANMCWEKMDTLALKLREKRGVRR